MPPPMSTGETEEQVIQRLGPPSEYAASVEGQLPPRGTLWWAGLVRMPGWCGLAVPMGLFAVAAAGVGAGGGHRFCPGDHGNPGGRGFGLSPLLLALAGLALVLAVFFLWRLARRKKGER